MALVASRSAAMLEQLGFTIVPKVKKGESIEAPSNF